MKRAFPKEVKPVSPKTADLVAFNLDAANSGLLKQASVDGNRKTGKSAAMIGLAISVGATSLFLPRQGEKVWAAEPIKADAKAAAAISGGLETPSAVSQAETISPLLPEVPTVLPNLPQADTSALKEDQTARAWSNAQVGLPNLTALNTSAPDMADEMKIGSNRGFTQLKVENPPSFSLNTEVPLQSEASQKLAAREQVLNTSQELASQLQPPINGVQSAQAEWGYEEFSRTTQVPSGGTLANLNVQISQKTEQSEQVFRPVAEASSMERFQPTVPAIVNLQTKPTKKLALPDLSRTVAVVPEGRDAVVVEPQQGNQTDSKNYRVNPGDTIDGISRNYGVASNELVRANHLGDPNSIKVDQTLKIPVEAENQSWQPATVVIPRDRAAAVPPRDAQRVQMPAPNLILSPNQSNSESVTMPVVPISAQPERNSSISNSLAPAGQPNIYPVTETEASTGGEGLESAYLERLRAEINKVRSKTRSSKGTNGQSELVQISAPNNGLALPNSVDVRPQPPQPATIKEVVGKDASVLVPSQPNNPEFDPTRPLPVIPREGESVQARIPSRSDTSVVATAPMGASSYDSQPRMVSPQLPPLLAPDTYLPRGGSVMTGYIWPAKGEFTSGYGYRWGRPHNGIDVAAPIGTPVVASAPGVITYAQWNDGGYGNLVEVTHPDGTTTLYGHNDRILVREGQQVEQGQQIAEMGSTGFSTGPHVHFELHPRGQGPVDPIAYLPR